MQPAGRRQGGACADRRVPLSAEFSPSFISSPLERLQDGLRVTSSLLQSSHEVHKPLTLQLAHLLLSLTISAPSCC